MTGSVISQLRFYDGIRKVKSIIEDKRLGDLIMANLTMKIPDRRNTMIPVNGGTWELDGGGQ